MSEIVYLDICCFKRPFDDAALERVRREAEAVAAVLEAAENGRLRIVRSPAHDLENEQNPREDRLGDPIVARSCGTARIRQP